MNKQVKERPILFNAEMVRAVLDGRKTVTRRVVKPQPVNYADGYILAADGSGEVKFTSSKGLSIRMAVGEWIKCPYGAPGDRLWVRETWTPKLISVQAQKPSLMAKGMDILYRATDSLGIGGIWRPSIFMPRWASRILLEVVSVKVERVQAISEDGAKLEGVWTEQAMEVFKRKRGVPYEHITPTLIFADLWDAIYQNWKDNPWVWVVEFKRVAS